MTKFAKCLRYGSVMALSAATGLIIGPPHYFVGHAHWSRVVWIPFSDEFLPSTDVILNLLAFFPFGLLYACSAPLDRRSILRTGALMLGLSSACEFYQIFCHTRFPTVTDIFCNTLGGLLGMLAGTVVRRASRGIAKSGD
jgi:glycopeptide antibiotics resistance protein